MKTLSQSVKLHTDEVIDSLQEREFLVFLCGPSMKGIDGSESPSRSSAILRHKLKSALEDNGFTVCLGEDEGLEELRSDCGYDAQTSEYLFLKRIHALVLIAETDGTFAELGLFSGHRAENENYDFILVINKTYETGNSYIKNGPVKIVENIGKVYFDDLTNSECYDNIIADVIERLRTRRGLLLVRKKSK